MANTRVNTSRNYPITSTTKYDMGWTTTAGNLLVVAVMGSGGVSGNMSMNAYDAGNTLVGALSACTVGYHAGGSSTVIQIFYYLNTPATIRKLAVTFTTVNDMGMQYAEYSPAVASTWAKNTGCDPAVAIIAAGGKIFTSNAITPANGDLLYAALSNEASSLGVISASTGLSGMVQYNTNHIDAEGENTSATVGNTSITFTSAANGVDYTLVAVAGFTPTGSGGATLFRRSLTQRVGSRPYN